MRHLLLRKVVFVKWPAIFASVILLGSLDARSADPPPRRGWHITIQRADAQKIDFHIAYFNTDHLTNWRVWHAGDPTDFDLPIEYRHAFGLWLWADCYHQQADFNLFYNNRLVQKWSFDGNPEDHHMNQEDSK